MLGRCRFGRPGDPKSPDIEFFEAGVICAQDTGVSRPAPDTVAGTTHVIDEARPFVSSNHRTVPAVIGIGFGVRASPVFANGVWDVVMSVTHPAFAGGGATQQSFLTSLGPQGAPGVTFYQFDYPYELALGDWTMNASVGDTIYYRATFTVVAPQSVPSLAGACGYLDLLS